MVEMMKKKLHHVELMVWFTFFWLTSLIVKLQMKWTIQQMLILTMGVVMSEIDCF